MTKGHHVYPTALWFLFGPSVYLIVYYRVEERVKDRHEWSRKQDPSLIFVEKVHPMADEDTPPPAASPPPQAWRSYLSEDLPRSVQESADSAIGAARSFQKCSSYHLRSLRDVIPQIGAQYRDYEEVFFHRVKDELMNLKEHPGLAAGVAASAILLMRGPRRFLFRHTLGRLRSEEAQFVRSEKRVKELTLSVDLMKKESKKLLERSALAEKDMTRGHDDLMDAGSQIQSLARSAYKVEAQAADLMDLLREIPGREALKLRADVATMSSHLRQQRLAMNKRILKISELGVPV